jgi:hypothetical protein
MKCKKTAQAQREGGQIDDAGPSINLSINNPEQQK